MKINSMLPTCMLLASFVGTANAGLMITKQEEGEAVEVTIYQDGVMVHLMDNKKATVIIDSKKNQCTWFNHDSRKFVRSCQAYSDFVSSMDAAMNKMMSQFSSEQQAMMSQFSLEQQAMMKQDMKNEERNLPKFQTKKIGSTSFQGFGINKYHFIIEGSGSPLAEVWLSPDLYKALHNEVDVKKIEKIFGPSHSEISSDFNRHNIQELLEKEIDALAERENYSVIRIKMMSRNNPSDVEIFGSQVIKITTKQFDLNQYKPPLNYKEVGSFSELSGFDLNGITNK